MQEPPKPRDYGASLMNNFCPHIPRSSAELRAATSAQAIKLVLLDQLVEEQHDAMKDWATRDKKLTKLYNSEQEHRLRLEKAITELTRQVHKYKRQLVELKDANEWRNMCRTKQGQIDELFSEKNDLKLTVPLCDYTIKKLEKRLTTARRRSATCETR
jgi:chromosome segregation ATPase